MSGYIQSFPLNEKGRDFVVGDIHGHFSSLRARLADIQFDPTKDRLFSAGDLIDRGPEGEAVLEWLAYPWFHPVRGNHEHFAMRYAKGRDMDLQKYAKWGGQWFMDLTTEVQQAIAAELNKLPHAIEVTTPKGLVGICHADIPVRDWSYLKDALLLSKKIRHQLLYGRTRIQEWDLTHVLGAYAVILGHTTVSTAMVLGNVYYIDTGGWLPEEGGKFTLLNLSTL